MKSFKDYLAEAEREIEDEGMYKAPEPSNSVFPVRQTHKKIQSVHTKVNGEKSIHNKNTKIDVPNLDAHQHVHVKKVSK